MPTFLLKKYNETSTDQVNKENPETPVEKPEEGADEPEEMKITVTGSISQIVATSLQKVLQNTQVHMEETEDSSDSHVKAISTENINEEPVDTLRSIQDNDFVFIHTNGFTTAQEEWFLTNMSNKTKNVVYTLEGLIKHVKNHFKMA